MQAPAPVPANPTTSPYSVSSQRQVVGASGAVCRTVRARASTFGRESTAASARAVSTRGSPRAEILALDRPGSTTRPASVNAALATRSAWTGTYQSETIACRGRPTQFAVRHKPSTNVDHRTSEQLSKGAGFPRVRCPCSRRRPGTCGGWARGTGSARSGCCAGSPAPCRSSPPRTRHCSPSRVRCSSTPLPDGTRCPIRSRGRCAPVSLGLTPSWYRPWPGVGDGSR